MKHKMIHYKGYFILALVFVFAAAILGTMEEVPPFPFFAAGVVLLIVGCVKIASRNASIKTHH